MAQSRAAWQEAGSFHSRSTTALGGEGQGARWELHSRRVEIAGIVHQPYGEWMVQTARNFTDAEDGFLTDKWYLILDRDPLYTAELRKLLRASGVEPLRLPTRSPNLNAYAERFVHNPM